jgi:serine/threonine-protein kinase RsbT
LSIKDADTIVLPLRSDEDVVRVRQAVRECLVSVGFSLIDQTKMVTAASELARNTVLYGGGGESHISKVVNGSRKGVSLVFVDEGPGIADLELALTDGYTSGRGMGLGLSGAKRLTDEFEIESEPGRGTTVKITKWKPF